jgi:hypothetical protein
LKRCRCFAVVFLCKLCEGWCCFEQVTWWLSYSCTFRKYLIRLSVQTEILRVFNLQTNARFQPETTPRITPNPYWPVIDVISYTTLPANEYSGIVSRNGQ